jgi:hypothetical protein
VDKKSPLEYTLEGVHGSTTIHQINVASHPTKLGYNSSPVPGELHKPKEKLKELNAIC